MKLKDCGSGINPLGPSNKIKSAVRKAVKNINNRSYTEMDRLKGLFESKFRLFSENMLFANSLEELIYLVPDVLKPRKVLIIGPAMNIYEDAAQSSGAEVSFFNASEADGFVFDISCVLKSLKNIDLVFFANPSRITGKMISREKLREFFTVLPAEAPHFVIDESLIEFAGTDDYYVDIIQNGKFTILRTTAYFYGVPGLELACAISSPEIIQLYEKKRHWDINLLSVEAAITAYKDSTFSKKTKQYMLFEKKTMFRMLDKIEWIRVYDTDTGIILLKIDKNPGEVTKKLERTGVAISDCSDIRGMDRSFFRVSVMKHENNLKLMSILKSLYQNR
jgi:threonine-phosphate decarboxylase